VSDSSEPPRLLDATDAALELSRAPGWRLAGNAIERTWRFADFKAAMCFVNAVAALAEREEHHPDITVRYAEVTLVCWTHSVGGLTRRDFDLARMIDTLGQ